MSDLSEIERINRSSVSETDRINRLSDVYWVPVLDGTESRDPFSAEFRLFAIARLSEISGRAVYDAEENEQSPYLLDAPGQAIVPSDYASGDSFWLGGIIQAHGGVLRALAVRTGERVLEYGPGDGQIILHLARMGCIVTAVDIEARYLTRIQAQASDLHLNVTTIKGVFGDSEDGVHYDRILFFEAFHHAMDHHELVWKLAKLLTPTGYIVLAGEPILEHDNYYRPTLPYAWGPRLDGLSLCVMQTYGWCELGFAREYFVELWMRAGFRVSFVKDNATSRGSAYIVKPRRSLDVDVTGDCLLEAWGFYDCWHSAEAGWRWSKSEACAIPLDESQPWVHVTLTLKNGLPLKKTILVESGGFSDEFDMAPGEGKALCIPLGEASGRITFKCPVNRPCDLNAESADTRELGFMITKMVYQD